MWSRKGTASGTKFFNFHCNLIMLVNLSVYITKMIYTSRMLSVSFGFTNIHQFLNIDCVGHLLLGIVSN